MHRMNWDLRYPGAVDFPGMIMWAASTRGPIAPPGSYQVRVTADSDTQTQPFAIKREPHVLADVTDADLQKQFDLAMQVRNKTTQANEAVLLVRGIKPQIKERSQQTRREGGSDGEGARRSREVAQLGRGRNLSGEAAERPGSAELSDQVEQQDRRHYRAWSRAPTRRRPIRATKCSSCSRTG